jgi:hypothetical protein
LQILGEWLILAGKHPSHQPGEPGLTTKNEHNADDAALGFLYQGQYALMLLWREADDDAVIYLETLDDVVLVTNGGTLLEQLKHSLKAKPPSLRGSFH